MYIAVLQEVGRKILAVLSWRKKVVNTVYNIGI